jgi:glycosyltransferase involved in cell wall biosynthesis
MARVAFYDPYLDVLGGGEKVLLTIVEDVAASGRHEVVIMSPTRPDLPAWRRLSLDVDPRRVRWRRANHLSATALSAGADLLIVVANHFPPLSVARRSAMIIQFPFAGLRDGSRGLSPFRGMERTVRIGSYDTVVCYSQFVADAVRERLRVDHPLVLAPPVDIPPAAPTAHKEAKVLAVGRFFPAADANNKKHEVLIEAWRQLARRSAANGWELHLVGGVHSDHASRHHLERLRESAHGLAVHFHPNAEQEELQDLYNRSAIFWHAAGYGETRPERLEHFGITTVEAMAHGCVPVVVALGGQVEIVEDRRNGRLWNSIDELISITGELMADGQATAALAVAAIASASRFSKQSFVANVRAAILTPAGIEA